MNGMVSKNDFEDCGITALAAGVYVYSATPLGGPFFSLGQRPLWRSHDSCYSKYSINAIQLIFFTEISQANITSPI